MRKIKKRRCLLLLALVVIESRAGAAAAKALLGEAPLLGVHAALARRREPVRRGRGAARRRPGPAAVRQRRRRRGPALRVASLALRVVPAGLREAARAWRRRRAPSVCPAFGRIVVARQLHGVVLARRGARTRCSRAHARRLVVGRRGRHAVDLSWAFGLPIVLKACDKQHAEDERHNEAPARASREERTTDGLRE